MAILIKRYANRKLYNTAASRYITLKGIAELLEAGEDVCVIDNETGEDITQVALSQILVDRERSKTSPSDTLLSQILSRGGDVLYGALRRGVDDASGGLEGLQSRVRRMVSSEDDDRDAGEGRGADPGRGAGRRSGQPEADAAHPGGADHRTLSQWLHSVRPDLDRLVQGSVERVFRLLDLPRRADVEALNRNLERVAEAIEMLERTYSEPEADDKPDAEAQARDDEPASYDHPADPGAPS